MQTLVNKTARELARDYYNGVLSFNDYRTRRRRLIDQLTGVAEETVPEPDAPEPEPEPLSPTVPVRMAGAAPEPVPVPATATPQARGFRPAVIAALVIGVAGIFGWMMFSGEDDADTEPVADATHGAPETPARQAPETDSVRQLVESFVRVDDWETATLGDFVLAWGALSETDQQRARQASWFRPLAEQLREQILEQRALGDIGTTGWEPDREEVLVSFAEHLGLSQLLADLGQTVIVTAERDDRSSVRQASEAVAAAQVAPQADAAAEPGAVAEPEEARQSGAVTQSQAVAEPEMTQLAALAPEPAVAPQPEVVQEAASDQVTVDREIPVVPDTRAVVPEVLQEQQPVPEPAAPVPPAPVAKRKSPPVIEPLAAKAPAPAAGDSSVKTQTGGPVEQASAAREPSTVERNDPCPASLARTRRPFCSDTLPDGKRGPTMVVLPAGGFDMGSTHAANEQPVHRVQIGKAFAVSAYEISHHEYQRFCRASGRPCPAAHWSEPLDPRVNVSWDDARAYSEWLSSVTGAVYRLPSEAEWEYAARGGTDTAYPFSEGDKVLPSDARFDASRPLPVNDRSVNLNGFRLRHIVGNAREWVADAWVDDYRGAPVDGSARLQQGAEKRVVRGGSYADNASRLRSSARQGLPAAERDKVTGFRVVREVRN